MNLVQYLVDIVILIANTLDLRKEVLQLLFLLLELAIFYVEVKQLPNVFWTQLWLQIHHLVPDDIRDVQVLDPYHPQHLENLLNVILRLLQAILIVAGVILLPNNVIDPLSLHPQALIWRIHPILQLKLKPLGDVSFNDLAVLRRRKHILRLIQHDLIEQFHILLHLIIILLVVLVEVFED